MRHTLGDIIKPREWIFDPRLVSDGYHIYRVKKMLQSQGMDVFGSPRPSVPRDTLREQWLYFRQAIAYSLWRVGIAV